MINNEEKLLIAACAGNVDKVKRLIELGTNINSTNRLGWMPLHRAAEYGFTNICKLLLDNGADVNAKTNYGDTPLQFSAINGSTGVCKLLLMRGADVNIKNEDGWTPLHYQTVRKAPVARLNFADDMGMDSTFLYVVLE